MSRRNLALYLEDIISSTNKIQKYTKKMSFEDFEKDDKTIDAIIRNVEVIGEAVNNLPKDFRNKYPDIPWSKIIAARNKMIHEYFGVDSQILWKTVKEDIPFLKTEIKKIL